MVAVCQTCGDRGFPVALIYCDNCQAYAVHRYCLDTLPATFEEYVVWFCVDCEPKVPESSTLQQALRSTGSQSRLKKGIPVRKLKGKNDITRVKKNKKSKKRKYDGDSFAISKVQSQTHPSVQPFDNLEKDETLRSSACVGGPSSGKEDSPSEAKTYPLKTCTSPRRLDWDNVNEKDDFVSNRTALVAAKGDSNIIVHNVFDSGLRELDGVYFDEAVECVKTKTSLVPISNHIPKHGYLPAQPIFEVIWRGSFHLYNEDLVVGVVAHLSSLACLRVFETAKRLPELLCLELLPRCDVWPKGFKKWGPSEESIALYFFPNNEREVKIFDSLVDKMIGQDLGMRAVVQDVELLVFTSKVLPLHFWRFQEKFYLWGVFRAKQASHQGEERDNLIKALTRHLQSPISPLSDSGSSSLSG